MLPKTFVLLATAAALSAPSLVAQTKQPLTHEMMWSFKRVGAPAASPDGKWVVFPVSEPAYDPAQDTSDLWIVPADGSAAPRRLTSTKVPESSPAWSPDSTRLAFATRREGDDVAQIYVMTIGQGGDPQRLTNAPTSVSGLSWSPDGRKIVFQAAMWAGAVDEESNRRAVAERKALKSRVRTFETFPIRNWDQWIEPTKPHIWVVDVDGNRVSRSLLAGSNLAGLPGFGGETLGAAWTPDGQSVVFAATDNAETAARASVGAHLWQVSMTGGELTRLTGDDLDVGAAKFSPDGRQVCFPSASAAPSIYALIRLACADWPWKTEANLRLVSKPLDRSVGSWGFAADGQSLFFTAEDTGHDRIFSVSVGGGAVKVAADAPQGVYTNLDIPRKAPSTLLVATWGSATNPLEVVRVDPATGGRTSLSTFNKDKAASIDWQPLREFSVTTSEGRKLHNFLVVPPAFSADKKYPLLVLVHGGHANMWRDEITYRWNYHLLSQPGFVVLLTDYRGSTGYGEKFTLDILHDPLKGPSDDVNAAADEAIKQFSFIDGNRQCAAGASYGGHIMNWLEGTSTRYKCLISHAGLASLDMQWATSDAIYHREVMMGGPFWENPAVWNAQSPLAKAGSFKTPMLLSVGESDYRVPINNALAMYSALQRMNVASRLLVWPDENHWIQKGENSRVFYREVRGWLEKYLAKE